MKRSTPMKVLWLLGTITFLTTAALTILNRSNPAILITLLISGFLVFLSSVLTFGFGMRKTLDDRRQR